MQNNFPSQFADVLLDVGAVKFGQFRLKLHDKKPDAPLSPVYVNLRIIRSFPLAMDLVVKTYISMLLPINYDILADIPTAATPFVGCLSLALQRPMITPRMDAKNHGSGATIDGSWQAGQTAVLIDDLITGADSKFEAISVLERSKLQVNDVVVLVDREQGGVGHLAASGYRCRAATTLRELVGYYREMKRIEEPDYLRTVQYLKIEA